MKLLDMRAICFSLQRYTEERVGESDTSGGAGDERTSMGAENRLLASDTTDVLSCSMAHKHSAYSLN